MALQHEAHKHLYGISVTDSMCAAPVLWIICFEIWHHFHTSLRPIRMTTAMQSVVIERGRLWKMRLITLWIRLKCRLNAETKRKKMPEDLFKQMVWFQKRRQTSVWIVNTACKSRAQLKVASDFEIESGFFSGLIWIGKQISETV